MVFPEPCGLCVERVHRDEPLQVRQRLGVLVPVREGKKWVEALADVAIDLAGIHQLEHAKHIIGRHVELGEVIEGPVVVDPGGIPPTWPSGRRP